MTLAHLVYRIASDPSFAAEFAKEADAALRSVGLTVDDNSASAVIAVLGDRERTRALCSLDQDSEAREWYNPSAGVTAD